MKLLFVLAIGVALGYNLGFKDAQTYKKNIVARVVDRVGGSNRDNFTVNNVDKQMQQAEGR
jgi:hypothetical protein